MLTFSMNARAQVARKLFNHLAALGLAAVALLASAAAWADPPGRVGRIAQAHGTVWMFDAEQGEWIGAQRNRPLTSGDRVSVERDARAELQIGSATLRLDGGSELEVSELNDSQVRLHLHHGSLALRLRSSETAREFTVTTAEGRFEPLSAGHYRIDQENNGSFAGAMAGVMRFEAPDSALEINAGQRAEFWIESGVTHYTWAALPNDRFASWVAQQDREDERVARQRPYVSPEMTGADDLYRYGDWNQHPEYGAIWVPRGVDPGWAPYRYGHWAFVQPWGYTWVDDAPWGFAPFHYGRWISWQGRWVWAPGQYAARPVYAPALVAWIGGPNVSIGINVGGGPAVGWVPLSPREVYVPHYNVTNVYVTNINTPYRRWQPPIRPNQPVRTGPIMYTNQGVAGGVTVVPQNVLRERKPISNAVIAPVDDRTINRWRTQPLQPQAPVMQGGRPQNTAPPAPPAAPSRVIAVPGGAVPDRRPAPPAPGAVRATPWGQVAPPPRATVQPVVPAAQGDGGQARPGRPPLADPRAGSPPAVEGAAPAQVPQQQPQREAHDRRSRGQDNARAAPQRVAPPQVVQPVPTTPPVQGVRTVPPQPAVVQPPAQPPARNPNADERDDRQPPGQERRREQRPGQQNQ
jgi:hypothetical protein